MQQAPSKSSRAFVGYLARRLPAVEGALARAAARPLADDGPRADLEAYLYRPLERFTASGGKRVRPVLALLGAEAVGGRPEQALSTGVAIELFQSAALIHDDIADKGELRRGEPCLHLAEGTGVAINVGDLALTRVFEAVLDDAALDADRRLRVLAELVAMERHTLEGQALDLGWVRDGRWDVTPSDYLYMIDSKTSWYSAAIPLRAGAVAAGGPAAAVDGLGRVGMLAGTAFQLADDLLNLVGDPAAQGKDFRSDITEGKRTLAVVTALERLPERDRSELVALLDAGTTDEADLARAVSLIERGGGIEQCRELARERAAQSRETAARLAMEGLITEGSCELLGSMADFFVERTG